MKEQVGQKQRFLERKSRVTLFVTELGWGQVDHGDELWRRGGRLRLRWCFQSTWKWRQREQSSWPRRVRRRKVIQSV